MECTVQGLNVLELSKLLAQVSPGGKSVTGYVLFFLEGGGYAEERAVSARLVLPVPSNVPLTYAASLPEAACNAWQVVSLANLGPGRSILIHECSGDIGLFILQMAKCKGALVYVVAENDDKLVFYKHHGAHICINYKNEDFAAQVIEKTNDKGVDVVVDSWAVNLGKDLEILGYGGKLFFVDLHGSSVGKVKFGKLMARQAKVRVVDRYGQTFDKLASIVDSVKHEVWPAIESGSVRPVVYRTLQLSEAAAAHSLMDSRCKSWNIFSLIGLWPKGHAYTAKVAGHIMGKILLTPDPEKSWKADTAGTVIERMPMLQGLSLK